MPTKTEAVEALRSRAALTLTEAEAIVDAVSALAVEDALAQIAGEEPEAGTQAELRASHVARICRRLDRLMSTREVEVVLRVPPATAKSTVGRVRAGWPEQADAWTAALVVAQHDTTEDITTETDGDRWKITFTDDAALEYAAERLRREGMSRGIEVTKAQQALVVPKEMRDRQGQTRDPLDVLGLPS